LSPSETIGVDLGGSKMRVAVVDRERRILHRSVQASRGRTGEEVLETLGRELDRARSARPDVSAAGLGIPCTVDQGRGVAVNAVNLPLVDVPIRQMMEERLGLPVFIDNDVNAAILAEHRFGAARGTRNAVMISLGTGIGGGLILDGRVYRGKLGSAGELGHMVVDMDGPECQGSCPNRGCIEAVASGTALGREGRAAAERVPESKLGRMLADGRPVEGEAVTDAAIAGDETSREVVALIGRRLGVAFASLANIFDPQVIVVGGGVIALGDLLLEPARQVLRSRALRPMNATPVAAAELRDEAGVVGAATIAMLGLEERVE
jgi:glucokinase